MKVIINSPKKSETWKIQLTIAINFISSKDTDEECVTHSESDKIEIMIYDKGDEIINRYQQMWSIVINRYEIGLEKSAHTLQQLYKSMKK